MNTNNAPELLPCPFCGGTANCGMSKVNGYTYRVSCSSCGYYIWRSISEGISADKVWNNRAAMQPAVSQSAEAMDIARSIYKKCIGKSLDGQTSFALSDAAEIIQQAIDAVRNERAAVGNVQVSESDEAVAYREALTPSAETKAAYHGEFYFNQTYIDHDEEETTMKTMVPWTTVKDIMAAIVARAEKNYAHRQPAAVSADAAEVAKKVRQVDHRNDLVTLEQVHAHCGEIVQAYGDACRLDGARRMQEAAIDAPVKDDFEPKEDWVGLDYWNEHVRRKKAAIRALSPETVCGGE